MGRKKELNSLLMTPEKRILNSAKRIFFEKGYSNTRMDELANDLSMSKKTIYKYFPNKKALLKNVIDDFFQNVNEQIDREVFLESNSFRDMLEKFVFIGRQALSRMDIEAINDIEETSPDLWRLMEIYRESIIKTRLREIFLKGREEGVIKEDLSVDVIVMITINTINQMSIPKVVKNLSGSYEDIAENIMDIILNGIIKK